MKVSLIKIGNSRGVRIPAKILEALDFNEGINIEIVNNESLLLKPVSATPRRGWADSFKQMHQNNADKLLIDDSLDIDLISDLDDENYEANSSI